MEIWLVCQIILKHIFFICISHRPVKLMPPHGIFYKIPMRSDLSFFSFLRYLKILKDLTSFFIRNIFEIFLPLFLCNSYETTYNILWLNWTFNINHVRFIYSSRFFKQISINFFYINQLPICMIYTNFSDIRENGVEEIVLTQVSS